MCADVTSAYHQADSFRTKIYLKAVLSVNTIVSFINEEVCGTNKRIDRRFPVRAVAQSRTVTQASRGGATATTVRPCPSNYAAGGFRLGAW